MFRSGRFGKPSVGRKTVATVAAVEVSTQASASNAEKPTSPKVNISKRSYYAPLNVLTFSIDYQFFTLKLITHYDFNDSRAFNIISRFFFYSSLINHNLIILRITTILKALDTIKIIAHVLF